MTIISEYKYIKNIYSSHNNNSSSNSNNQTKLKNEIYDTIFIYLLRCIFHIFYIFSDECLSSSSPNYTYNIHIHIYKHEPYIHLAQRKIQTKYKINLLLNLIYDGFTQ